MARISDDLLVQLVGDDLVVMSGGQEIRIYYRDINRFLLACDYLRQHAGAYDEAQVMRETDKTLAEMDRVLKQMEGGGGDG